MWIISLIPVASLWPIDDVQCNSLSGERSLNRTISGGNWFFTSSNCFWLVTSSASGNIFVTLHHWTVLFASGDHNPLIVALFIIKPIRGTRVPYLTKLINLCLHFLGFSTAHYQRGEFNRRWRMKIFCAMIMLVVICLMTNVPTFNSVRDFDYYLCSPDHQPDPLATTS